MKNYLKCLLLMLPFILASCEEDAEPQVVGQFDSGVFISNEGNFGEGDGSLSFISSSGVVSNNLFSTVNGGALGDVVQSLHVGADQLFAVVNNSNKVEAMTLDSLKSAYTITDVSLPRYMVSHDGVGYVSEWVSFSDLGRVTLFDLETGTVDKSITTDYGAEGLIITQGRLFVTNNFTTTVSVIDLSSEEVVASIQVGNSPAGMVLDADGDVWVVCSGGYDTNYAPLNDGKLVELNPASYEVKSETDLNANLSGKIAVAPSGQTIYYLMGNQVYSLSTDAPEAGQVWKEEAAAVSFYGIGVDQSGNVYAADAKGFAENGEVFVYNPAGELQNKYTVGRGPNGFAFN
ncbi:DUF5074 domain-containing protein [Marinoscillum luteum]|uniref:DUF5074 domain-containing protein n=1 Tax=Marinoscillum luteum TaxID=861051 RepID=A0ABW7N981_9BACT